MTPYDVLGIAPDATEQVAEEAYYHLLLIHHPDLHQSGTAEEMAGAEARTQALNLAMQQVRRSFAGRVRGPTRTDSTTPENGSQNGRDNGRDDRADAGHREEAGPIGDEARWDSPPPPRCAGCPFCGEGFTDAHLLRAHVEICHKVRLVPRPRSRLGRRLARLSTSWHHVPLWYLVPFNALIALIIAVAVAPLATDFAYWVFGVAMAPTFILLLDKGISSR